MVKNLFSFCVCLGFQILQLKHTPHYRETHIRSARKEREREERARYRQKEMSALISRDDDETTTTTTTNAPPPRLKKDKVEFVFCQLFRATSPHAQKEKEDYDNDNNNAKSAAPPSSPPPLRRRRNLHRIAKEEALCASNNNNALKMVTNKDDEFFFLYPSPLFKIVGEGAQKYHRRTNDDDGINDHHRDLLSLARMSEQFQSRVVALRRVKELSSSIKPTTTRTKEDEEAHEEDVDFLHATNIFAPGSLKAKYIVEVMDGNSSNEKKKRESRIVQKKKREVYALTTALRSVNGLARYIQMPPMKEEEDNKKETHERLRAEARRKRDLVLQSKKTIIEAYKEMMMSTPKKKKSTADEKKKKTASQESTDVAKRPTSATKETKEQRMNKSEKEAKPQNKTVVPVVAKFPPKGRKQKRTPFSPPRIFGQEITNNNN